MEYIECRKCDTKVKVAFYGPNTGIYLTCKCDSPHVGRNKVLPDQVNENFWVKESEELDDKWKELVE